MKRNVILGIHPAVQRTWHIIYQVTLMAQNWTVGGSPRRVVAKVLDYDIVVSEFEL